MLAHTKNYGTIKRKEAIGLKLNPGNLEPCDACADLKAKQKNIPKKNEHKPSTKRGVCIYIHTATVNNTNNSNVTVAKTHWKIEVDKVEDSKYIAQLEYLPQGLYTIRVYTEQGILNSKLLKY